MNLFCKRIILLAVTGIPGLLQSQSVPGNTFMLFGNTYIRNPELAKTTILESINQAVEDADIDFVIMVGEVTLNGAVEEFEALQHVEANSPVPVYFTAGNHDEVNGSYDRFSEMLDTEPEYTLSKGRSFFVMQSHVDENATSLSASELDKLENSTEYDFVYIATETPPVFDDLQTSGIKPTIGLRGGVPTEFNLIDIDGRHVRIVPTENNPNDNEDDYVIIIEKEGHLVVDSYVDRSLERRFKIFIDRTAETSSFEELDPILYSLTLADVEGGTITSDQTEIEFPTGTEIAVTVELDEGYEFAGWAGDLSGTENPQTITITRDMNISANFTPIVSISAHGKLHETVPTITSGSLNLAADGGVMVVTVYDMNGQKRLSQKIIPGQTTVSLSELEPGRYLVKYITAGGSVISPLLLFR